jgi:hypothetical protein
MTALLTADRESPISRAAAANPPLSTTLAKARMLSNLCIKLAL